MAIECTKLPILSSVQQAYHCLWHYKIQHVMISIVAALPFCLAGFAGYLEPVFSVSSGANVMPDGFNTSFAILVCTTFIWAIPVIILWHRLYLLGPEHLIRHKIWPLITRSLKIISHSLILFGVGLIFAITITGSVLYLRVMGESEQMLGTISQMGSREYALYIFGIMVVLSFILLIALRLSMAFSSHAIGKSMRFTTSWQITRKNTFRMLAATLIGSAPLGLIQVIVIWAGNYFYGIDLLAGAAPSPYMIYSFVLVSSPLLALPLAILCSLTSTFYRHCGCAEIRETQR